MIYTKYIFGFHGYSFTGQLVINGLLAIEGCVVKVSVTCSPGPRKAEFAVWGENGRCGLWMLAAAAAAAAIERLEPTRDRIPELTTTGFTGTGIWTCDSVLK